MFRPALFTLLLLLALPALAQAQIVDEDFGFTFTPPEGFNEVESIDDGMTIYTFLDREPMEDEMVSAIQIQRLEGLIDPTERINAEDIPQSEGLKISIEERQWQGLALDAMVMELELPEGAIITYTMQFPLAEEAVQLVVAGPLERKEELLATFNAAITAFENTNPLYEGGGE